MINWSTKYRHYDGIDKRNVFVCLSLCQPVFMGAWLSVCLSIPLSICLSASLSASVSICLFICLSISRRLIQCSSVATLRQCLSLHNSKAVSNLFQDQCIYKFVMPPIIPTCTHLKNFLNNFHIQVNYFTECFFNYPILSLHVFNLGFF